MERVERVLRKADFISKIFYYISAAALVVLFLLIFFDVAARSLFASPIIGTDVLSTYLMVCVGFLPLGYGLLRGAHVKMEYFGTVLYKRQRIYIDPLITLVVLTFFVVMTMQVSERAYSDWAAKVLMANTNIPWPVWFHSLIAAIGSAMLVIAIIMQFIREVLLIVNHLSKEPTGGVEKRGV